MTEYLNKTISYFRRISSRALLLDLWYILLNTISFILFFGFWLTLMDIPKAVIHLFWIIFILSQILIFRKDIAGLYQTLNINDKQIEKFLYILSKNIPVFHQLLSAFQLFSKSKLEGNEKSLAAAEQKTEQFVWPRISLPGINFRPYITYTTILVILLSSAIGFDSTRFVDGASQVLYLQEPGKKGTSSFEFSSKSLVHIERDSILITGKYSGKKENMEIFFHIIDFNNDLVRQYRAERDSDFYYIKTALPAGQYYGIGQLNESESDPFFRSDTVKLVIKTRPIIKYFKLTLKPPPYTKLKTSNVLDRGNLILIPGTKVFIKGESNKPLITAYVILNGNREISLKTHDNLFTGNFVFRKENRWQLTILDMDTLEFNTEPAYQIEYLDDLPPTISILEPPGDVKLFDIDRFPVLFQVEDDFGISRINFSFRIHQMGIPAGQYQSFNILGTIDDIFPVRKFYDWDLNPLNLFAGETIEYFLTAWDNNEVSGQAMATTDTLKIIIPSLFEQMEDAENRGDEQIAKIENAKNLAMHIEKKLAEIKRELLQKEKLDYKLKSELQENIKEQRELLESVEKLSKEIKDKIDEMNKKGDISAETLEKYKKIQDMIQSILPPDLKEKLDKLQRQIEKEDIKNLNNSLSQLDTQKFVDEINRTYELLKKIQNEEKLEQMISALSKIAEMQKQVTDSLTHKKWERSLNNESQISEDFKSINKNLDKLLNDLNKTNSVSLDDSTVLKKPTRDSIVTEIAELKDMIAQKSQQSSTSSREMAETFARMSGSLSDAQKQMQDKSKSKILDQIIEAVQESNRISEHQENLLAETIKINPLMVSTQSIVKRQVNLSEQMPQLSNDILAIGNETFLLPASVYQRANEGRKHMAEAGQNLSQKQIPMARNKQAEALSDMNILTLQLLRTLENASKSQSGTGSEKFMEMMQKMAGMQGQLNSDGRQLLQQGGSTPSQLSGMAQRQRAIKDALEKAAEEQRGDGGLGNRMGQITEEMDKIADLIDTGRLDQQILKRQEKIFDRLLDSQKSLRKKEFSKKRESERAVPYIVVNPGKDRRIFNTEESWEKYFKLYLKQQRKDRRIKQLRQYYEQMD